MGSKAQAGGASSYRHSFRVEDADQANLLHGLLTACHGPYLHRARAGDRLGDRWPSLDELLGLHVRKEASDRRLGLAWGRIGLCVVVAFRCRRRHRHCHNYTRRRSCRNPVSRRNLHDPGTPFRK